MSYLTKEEGQLRIETRTALLEKIKTIAGSTINTSQLVQLAEAYEKVANANIAVARDDQATG